MVGFLLQGPYFFGYDSMLLELGINGQVMSFQEMCQPTKAVAASTGAVATFAGTIAATARATAASIEVVATFIGAVTIFAGAIAASTEVVVGIFS